MSAERRSSRAPGADPPSVTVHDTAHIADKASLIPGPTQEHAISIGQQCVLHPFAKVDAGNGPVRVGDACVVWEKALVGAAEEGSESGGLRETRLGNGSVVQSHAVVQVGALLGEGVVVGTLAKVGAGAVVGDGATITANGSVLAGSEIPAGAIVGRHGRVIRIKDRSHPYETAEADLSKAKEMKAVGDARQRALLRKLVKGQAGGVGRSG